MTVPAPGVLCQCLDRRGMQGDEPRLAELAALHGEHTALQIHVASAEVQGLRDPQAGGDEQTEEGDVGVRPQPSDRAQLGSRAQQRGDLRLGVDVRRRAAERRTEQAGRRNFGFRIEQAPVLSEPPHDLEAPCPPERPRPLGQSCPADGQLDGDGTSMPDPVRVPGESQELLAGGDQCEAELPPEREVLLDQVHHARRSSHDRTSGQGCATSASVVRSSLV